MTFDLHPEGEEEGGTYIGLRLSRPEGLPLKEAQSGWKEAILEKARELGAEPGPGIPFITITMPCGNYVVYDNFEDIPEESVPCSCGDPTHWFVQYVFSRPISSN